jgi:hypothetical protein
VKPASLLHVKRRFYEFKNLFEGICSIEFWPGIFSTFSGICSIEQTKLLVPQRKHMRKKTHEAKENTLGT